MFVLILGVALLALIDQYGSGLIPNKARRKQLGTLVDTALFVLAAIFVFGLMSGDG